MPARKYATATYRFGFNGKENVNEIDGTGNNIDFGARVYDSRLGRWLTLDPLLLKYPDQSPYVNTLDNPIYFRDANGSVVVDQKGNPVTIEIQMTKNGKYYASYKFVEGTLPDVKESFYSTAGAVIREMIQQPTGRELVNKLNTDTKKVLINVRPETRLEDKTDNKVVTDFIPGHSCTVTYGLTSPTERDQASGALSAVEIDIYAGSIDLVECYSEDHDGKRYAQVISGGTAVITSDMNQGEQMGAAGTHEGTHATDAGSMRANGATAAQVEIKPNANTLKFYEECDQAQHASSPDAESRIIPPK
jgi:RHS repeat-associated protein